MRFGFCAAIEQTKTLGFIGYDFIEPSVVSTLQPEFTEEAFDVAVDFLPNIQITVDAMNVFLPGALKVTGPDVDFAPLESYVSAAMSRAAKLRTEIIVFGSGAARGVPDGFDHGTAMNQIADFLKMAASYAKPSGVTIAIEPLNRGECNIINSVAEAVTLANAVNHPNVAVLSDLYHVSMESQSYKETEAAGSRLVHVHVAGKEDRRCPTPDDIDHLAGFFSLLKSMDYQGRISIEGKVNDIAEDAKIGLETLRAAWAKA